MMNCNCGHTAGNFPAVSVIVGVMNILSIQSHVAYGHVGNSAAVFPLQRMGVEVWPIHTVQFSNHTGYGKWQGRVFDAALIRELVGGIEQRGVLGECDGVLSGYMGGADIGAAILDAVATVKRANPSAKYCCDPVIGDVGRGVYVREGIAGIHEGQGGAGRRYRDAQPVRARLSERTSRARRWPTRSTRSRRCMRSGRAPFWSPRCMSRTRRRMRSICSPPTIAAAFGCARRSCHWR